ncbi:MAG: aminotransferase class III-fold pyridoxal phosphate-dependent enzyme [Alphaproteobacteria bacterium]|nr:aminotransferase class III-fold pyridoxal phosphate-dependent enzyme [Alphaproteobacteria bacterium]MBU0804268.1 aminotransferase class III-fold pyridoxal phosphate-dependent enzyme [Alphaproteobacteria bacterium]MBU0871099.1 aminotransferase class III-fold pyridoxal phosphate-dependent enzyme [Alphaproteobacteria bacterium]MBU1400854.1 aminotransferase class III-fold pyridoxal phosphate-dependent enzyme [Alphaproteobacteria bacterium]MBU1592729.1 aminotransferase class III-fold pyridoxal ph
MSDVKPQSPEKREFIAKSKTFWNPGKTQAWQDMGVDLVIDRREGYFIWDMDGRRLIDLHLNGGTYNIGHRHPELIEILNRGTQRFDMGNHHFPSQARTALAERLAEICGGDLHYTMYASGGAEAIDIALKTARHATQRRKIVSIVNAYHGHTGLAVAAGADRFKKIFLSDQPEDFVHVPFNDLTAMEDALKGNDVAALIMETIPATYGFPMPLPGYLKDVKKLCEHYGALYVADEVQTGLMRCGEMWGYQRYGIVPDMVVTGKGISGGMYPIACVVVREPYAGWLTQDGFAHMSTMGGAELGCLVAMKTLEILQRPPVKPMVNYISETFRNGLHEIMKLYPDFFVGIRQCGVVMGLEFDFPEGAKPVMRHLYENGVWAIFSTLDPRVLQFKPGVLMTADLCQEVLERVERSVGLAYAECMGRGRGKARAA